MPECKEILSDVGRVSQAFAVYTGLKSGSLIVRGGEDWQTLEPHERVVDWEVADAASGAAEYYYARIEREDGWMSWSSPVRVNG